MTRPARLALGSALVLALHCGSTQVRPGQCIQSRVDALKAECSARRDKECPGLSDAQCPVVAECDRRLEEECPTF